MRKIVVVLAIVSMIGINAQGVLAQTYHSQSTMHLVEYKDTSSTYYTTNTSNNTITKAYDPWYVIVGASVRSSRLVRDSSKQATYYFEFGTPYWDLGGWTGHVRAKINGSNQLIVSYK